ncbi:hypothetical protein Pint_04746 [Pistacia integerrima]|uniref:Uncharacterized protein n=1 Tax=Pistacia integerrima TaxID=434235 RepID=A0ACC0Z4J9_9ROSI|nr:hypothetical protein Pint_04746 [Pistacia integerrima]
MFTLCTFRAPCCNPIIVQHLFTISFLCFQKTQNYFRCFCFQKQLQLPLQSMAPSVVAEYAKSNRSACKKCSEKIAAQALRLGSVSRDSRGFDLTKWHHVDCFPFASEPIDSADSIKGFSSLKSGDQEALKKLVVECKKSSEEVSGRSQNENAKVQKTNEDKEEVELEEGNSKRIKVVNTLSLVIDYYDTYIHFSLSTCKLDVNFLSALFSCDSSKLSIPSREANLEIPFSVSDINETYKDAKLLPNWKAFQTIIFLERDDGLHDSKKIAAFDFDGCLAKTSVKRVGADAWSLMYPSIPDKLQSLYNDGYKLVIFTNESNIERWKNKRQTAVDSKIGRLNNFIKRVKVPIQVFIACGLSNSDGKVDPFRKPKPGMWQIMEKHFNSGIPIDMDQSFYVGDAAGRDNDHSDADIKFAQAIGLKFYVPEDYFVS